MIGDDYNYDETSGFHSLADGLMRDHMRLDDMIHKNYEFDKVQEQEISANTQINEEQKEQIKTNAEVNANQEIEISANTDAIKAENVRATDAETDLQTQLNNEVQRAKDAEQVLQDEIDAEIARATSAETAEYNRATSAETEIKQIISDDEVKHKGDIDLIDRTIAEINAAITNIKTQLDAHTSLYNLLKEKTEDSVDNINKSISSLNDEVAQSATLTQLNNLEKRVSILENK